MLRACTLCAAMLSKPWLGWLAALGLAFRLVLTPLANPALPYHPYTHAHLPCLHVHSLPGALPVVLTAASADASRALALT